MRKLRKSIARRLLFRFMFYIFIFLKKNTLSVSVVVDGNEYPLGVELTNGAILLLVLNC